VNPHGPKNPERSFGITVGTVLLFAAAYWFWRGAVQKALIAGGVGVVLVVLGATAPRLLKWPSAVWWSLARTLGYVNARVILTIVFVFVLAPIGLIWRVIGRDPLARRRSTSTGWSPYPARYRSHTHFRRMY